MSTTAATHFVSSSENSSPKLSNKPMLPLGSTRPPLARIFSVVEYGSARFLILDCPTEANLQAYLKVINSCFAHVNKGIYGTKCD